jgi:small-conductance mechanosensitive channel
VFDSQPRVVYVQQRRSVLHGPLTVLLILWALALPVFLLLLTGLGPVGWILGLGATILLAIPWLIGVVILWFLRHIS